MIQNHLNILEQTFVIVKVTPFVGNKRTEITSNPIYYFIDNGFRNQALRNFLPMSSRTDTGLLVESFVFQEIYKYKTQHYLNFDIHYWRTKSGAEVDFILYKNREKFLPIEVKYQSMKKPQVSRGFRSFLEAYQPPEAVIITRNDIHQITIGPTKIHFVPLSRLNTAFKIVNKTLQ